MIDLPEDQYYVMNILTNRLGNQSNKKYPYYFVTGSAGTGKSSININKTFDRTMIKISTNGSNRSSSTKN